MLSIVEILREFRTMLYGWDITIFTDNKKKLWNFPNLNTQRVLCWRVFIEECGPKFANVNGQDNIIADFSAKPPSQTGRKHQVHLDWHTRMMSII